MNCWEFLELPPESEERAIKRRYAQLLKTHRPDGDSAAFQRLRAAYDQALQQARWGADDEVDDHHVAFPVIEATDMAIVEPAVDSTYARRFAEFSLTELEACLTRAEVEGARQPFEQGLLGYCLECFPTSREPLEWALSRLHWFDLGQCSELPQESLNRLACCLVGQAQGELLQLLTDGQERAFIERLNQVLVQPWLQAFDRRTQFQKRLIDGLLASHNWSAEFFEQVCRICDWSDGLHAGEGYQWRALVDKAEAAAYEKRLRGFMTHAYPVDAEQNAVWALLKPMGETRRNELMSRFSAKDRQACGHLSDTLKYRYPHLLERFGSPDLDMWHKSLLVLTVGNGWAHINLAVWLLIEISMLPMAMQQTLTVGVLLSVTMATFFFLVFRALFSGWRGLLDCLGGFDRWLSQLVLPDTLGGLLLLQHLLPCAALSLMLASVQPGLGFGVRGLTDAVLVFVGSSYYLYYATRGVSLLGRVLGILRERTVQWLIATALMTAMGLHMVQYWKNAVRVERGNERPKVEAQFSAAQSSSPRT